MKHVTIKEKELPKKTKYHEKINHIQQIHQLNELYLHNTHTHILHEIKKKRQSYLVQDKLKKRDSSLEINDIIELLVISKLKCSYCTTNVYLLYENAYDKEQWTLDRIDNDKGHTINNCVISCLKCNLSKRRICDSRFRFTKQLVLEKMDGI